MPEWTTLGQRIYYARVYQGKRSLRDFGAAVAKRLDRPKPFSEVTVSQWQRNCCVPDFRTLIAIAQEANVKEEWLLLNRGNPTW